MHTFFFHKTHFFFLVQECVKIGLQVKKNVYLVPGIKPKSYYLVELMDDQWIVGRLEKHFRLNLKLPEYKKNEAGVIR